ncbi:cytochrome B5 isoform D [Actinidia rufa]|uniref:Cytochrome B5 isoform D n=1 Tax=Actinidia rufa TaxID=165716 RepID=A0A7J0GIV5_9ERIC|nr:cytochrome B5 isoform D [Actinidia rufa]
MEADQRGLSFAEVSSHNDSKDCWVIINAKVYDVTNFLADHPGGEEVLLAAAGKDASEEFEDVGHGSAARLMLDEFYVGEVDPSSIIPKLSTYAPSEQHHDNDDGSSGFMTKKLLRFLVPFAVSVVAAGIYLIQQ